MADLILPDPRMEMPELFEPGRKPVCSVEVVGNVFDSGAVILGPVGNALELNRHLRPTLTGTTAAGVGPGGQCFISTGLQTDGCDIDRDDFTFDGASELTILLVLELPPTVFDTSGTNAGYFRESTSTNRGVSLSGQDNTTNIRGLIFTNLTGIWTGTQDVSVAAYMGKRCLMAMTWDGSARKLYIGEITKNVELLRSDTCTGSVSIENAASADCTFFGGAHIDARGPKEPIYSAVAQKKHMTIEQLDRFCQDPYQFLIPA